MVDKLEHGKLTPREQLIQELLYHANNSANRALEFSARATANMLAGDEGAAMNCQYLADLNSNDALQSAFEAGEVASTNIKKGNDNDQHFVTLIEAAGVGLDISMEQMMEAQSLLSENKNPEEAKNLAIKCKSDALEMAYEAGIYTGNGIRSGIRPTFTLDPEETTI